MVKSLEAVVLCGGLGLRLRPAVPDLPKCLAPVGGRPFLEFVLLQLRCSGIRDVTLCVGYRNEQVREYFGNGKQWGLAIRYSVENGQLGTAGALKHAQRLIRNSPFIALNGDSILELDFGQIVEFHRRRSALVTLALAEVSCDRRYGSVLADDSGQVMLFHEKMKHDDGAGASFHKHALINAGVYVLNREIFDAIPCAPPAVSLETAVFPCLIGRGLYGCRCDGYFVDIGIPQDYAKAQRELPERFHHAHTI